LKVSPPAVQVARLTHRYGERVALRNVSITVGSGEIVGILGPNGSGKTSLFRILSTLIEPSERSSRLSVLQHELPRDRDASRRDIAVVFQSPSLDRQLTAEENLRHHGHLYGLTGSELRARIAEMLAAFGVSDRARERVSSLSGGLRRRVELAKGLLTRPKLLLMDEPSTGLDPSARLDLWSHLKSVRQASSLTVMLTTHLMDEAERCDRVAILDQGVLLACDAPENLKEQIGPEMITICSDDPQNLTRILKERFSFHPQVVGETLRVECPRAHELVPRIVELASGMIRSISVGRPGLEDVFVKLTGHRFANHDDEFGA
jgi:ABC-2 type transport system ATP-binding protein